jgi:hypothetical protein
MRNGNVTADWKAIALGHATTTGMTYIWPYPSDGWPKEQAIYDKYIRTVLLRLLAGCFLYPLNPDSMPLDDKA